MNYTAETMRLDDIIVDVKRTKRKKTATIKVAKGKVSLIVPQDVEQQFIVDLLAKKKTWINNKLASFEQHQEPPAKRFVSGEQFMYRGNLHELSLNSVANFGKTTINLTDSSLRVRMNDKKCNASHIQRALTNWYKDQAKQVLTEKVEKYAKIIGVAPTALIVRSYKRRWGSCNSAGKLSFNWKIIMAPDAVSDYVIVHELCHLVHLNHSPQFWQHVAHHMSDYKTHEQWLKQNGWRFEW